MSIKPRAYKLLAPRFGKPAGTIVYDQLFHDYGLASADTRNTGFRHVTVTLDPEGGYPGFTVRADHIVPLEALEPEPKPEPKPEPTVLTLNLINQVKNAQKAAHFDALAATCTGLLNRLAEAERTQSEMTDAKDIWRQIAVTRGQQLQAQALSIETAQKLLRAALCVVSAGGQAHAELEAQICDFLLPPPTDSEVTF